MKHKLNKSPEQVYESIKEHVTYARKFTDDVEWSCEDGTRTDMDYMCKTVELAINSGAKTINIPDTVGYTVPSEFTKIITTLKNKVPNIDKAKISVHCHNDLGLAVANSLAGVVAGARQVECTINGLGERAGNAALEEIVMTVKTRQDIFNCDTNIKTNKILKCSRLVSGITGFPVQPNKAIVGKNAFAHESGIHQDGVIKSRETYEIMKAEDIGLISNSLVLGKHSGRNAFKQKIIDLNVMPKNNSDFDKLFYKFKDLADKKHEIFDEDLINLATNAVVTASSIKFNYMNVVTESGRKPHAHIKLEIDGEIKEAKSTGDGAVDAAYNAIEHIIKSKCKLILYSVNNITSGTDAQGEVTVRITKNNSIYNGHGADTDIVKASVLALLNALNKYKQNPNADSSKKRGI